MSSVCQDCSAGLHINNSFLTERMEDLQAFGTVLQSGSLQVPLHPHCLIMTECLDITPVATLYLTYSADSTLLTTRHRKEVTTL